jgi:DNA-binding GntR family transcriptional regulator
MLTPIDKSSLSEEVAKKIRQSIFSGRIRPGEKLLEQELSTQLNTSRGPIRDAFIRLEHEGLVLREPNRTALVVEMSWEDVEEIYSLRLVLENLALRYLCNNHPPSAIASLEAAVEKLRRGLADGASLDEAVEHDLEFHEEVVRASGHGRLHKMWLSIRPQIGFLIFTKNIHNVLNFAGGADQHEELISAIIGKDYATCELLLKEHITNVLSALRDSFKEKSEI